MTVRGISMKTHQQSEGRFRQLTLALVILATALMFSNSAFAQQPANGELRGTEQVEVWSKELNKWLSPIQFWRSFAVLNGGLTWGERETYPEYSKVKERDLMIIELDSGSCLMEFFHRRWRRANDVRRWDTKFNEVAGCQRVFD